MTTQRSTTHRAARGTLRRFLVRRRFIVDRRFQGSLIGGALSWWAFYVTVLATSLFGPLIFDFQMTTDGPADPARSAAALLYLHNCFWPAILLCTAMVMLTSLRISHRIAGPLYHVKVALRELERGSVPERITTRRGDFLDDEIVLFNDTMATLGQRVAQIHAATAAIDSQLQACRVSPGDDTDLAQRLQRLQRLTAEVRTLTEQTRQAGATS